MKKPLRFLKKTKKKMADQHMQQGAGILKTFLEGKPQWSMSLPKGATLGLVSLATSLTQSIWDDLKPQLPAANKKALQLEKVAELCGCQKLQDEISSTLEQHSSALVVQEATAFFAKDNLTVADMQSFATAVESALKQHVSGHFFIRSGTHAPGAVDFTLQSLRTRRR